MYVGWKNYKEVMTNTEIIIAEWLETAKEEGWPIREPKGRLKYA
jgi:predicted RNase H-like HicB family nuclease